MSKRTVRRVQACFRGLILVGFVLTMTALILGMGGMLSQPVVVKAALAGVLAFALGTVFGGCL